MRIIFEKFLSIFLLFRLISAWQIVFEIGSETGVEISVECLKFSVYTGVLKVTIA